MLISYHLIDLRIDDSNLLEDKKEIRKVFLQFFGPHYFYLDFLIRNDVCLQTCFLLQKQNVIMTLWYHNKNK